MRGSAIGVSKATSPSGSARRFAEVRRQGDEAVGFGRDDGAGNEARNPQHDICRRDLRRQHALRGHVRGMTGLRCGDEDMALGEEAGARPRSQSAG